MTAVSDVDKKLTLGDPDGPMAFIPYLDREVPTFVDPRVDLIASGEKAKFRRLNFHVPFKMRGPFKPSQWPEQIRDSVKYRLDQDGYVLCTAESKMAGGPCRARAMNRVPYCRVHGGALHAADRKISAQTLATIPKDRISNLDRVQQFMQGFIDPSELADDEVAGGFIRNSQGVPVISVKLGAKFTAMLTMELHERLNRYLQSQTPAMLQVMVDIASSDFVEPADRIKAATWVAERTMGKTPEVLVHKQGKPYESVFEALETSSRDAYRKGNVIDAEIVGDDLGEDFGESSDLEYESETHASTDLGETSFDPRTDGKSSHTQSVDAIAEAKERRERLRKAKARRYAARATGANSVDDTPWLIEFKPLPGGNFTARLYYADEITQGRLAKMAAQG